MVTPRFGGDLLLMTLVNGLLLGFYWVNAWNLV